MLIVWLLPKKLYGIVIISEKKKREEEQRRKLEKAMGGSGGDCPERRDDKPAEERVVFPETLRINGETHYRMWANDEQADYRNSSTDEIVHLWYTDLPDYD